MKRWGFNLLAACSLLLCLATISMWIRSHLASDRWYWPDPKQLATRIAPAKQLGRSWPDPQSAPPSFTAGLALRGSYVINSAPGAIEYVIDSPPWPRVTSYHSQHELPPGKFYGDTPSFLAHYQPVEVHWSFIGFSHESIRGRSAGSSILPKPGMTLPVLVQRWTIPYWPAAALTAILPLLWISRRLRMQSSRLKGCCHNCGYDLRASPDRCPECGTIPAV